MYSLYLDPAILACPKKDQGADKFESFLGAIILLREMRKASWSAMIISAETADLLVAAEAYPLWSDLVQCIEEFCPNEIQPQDVIALVNSLIEKLPTIEDSLGVTCVLISDFETDPPVNIQNRHKALVNGWETILSLVCLRVISHELDPEAQILLTQGLAPCPEKLSIQSMLNEYEGSRHYAIPTRLFGAVRLHQDQRAVIESLEFDHVWTAIGGDILNHSACYQQVFELAIPREATRRMVSSQDFRKWKFGHSFLETAKNLGFLDDQAKARGLLKTCLGVLFDIAPRNTHALRSSRGPNAETLMRGNDAACRKDIDHEYHLHYWDGPSGVEFACVVPHNDFDIIF